MKDETKKIVNWIEIGYTRLNYKEELSLVDYIKQLQQENKHLKEHIEKYEHYCKTTGIEEIMQENKRYKEVIGKAIKCIDYNTKHRNGADIYQFADIKSEILEPLKFILELDEENGNAYLKEFKDWLNEVE